MDLSVRQRACITKSGNWKEKRLKRRPRSNPDGDRGNKRDREKEREIEREYEINERE